MDFRRVFVIQCIWHTFNDFVTPCSCSLLYVYGVTKAATWEKEQIHPWHNSVICSKKGELGPASLNGAPNALCSACSVSYAKPPFCILSALYSAGPACQLSYPPVTALA